VTAPQFPSPNPGGQNRRLIRTILADWVIAQRIGNVAHVYATVPTVEWRFDAWPTTGTGFAALVAVHLGPDTEDRAAYTGPVDPGGKLVHYAAELRVKHWAYELDDDQDSTAAQDDFDRVADALKDCLRGRGRDLGRPEIVLHAGEWPREAGLTFTPAEPVDDNGSILRAGTLSFNVTQYLTTTYPGT
jgi:hypothetical protein